MATIKKIGLPNGDFIDIKADALVKSNTAPTNPYDGQTYINTTNGILFQYNASLTEWIPLRGIAVCG